MGEDEKGSWTAMLLDAAKGKFPLEKGEEVADKKTEVSQPSVDPIIKSETNPAASGSETSSVTTEESRVERGSKQEPKPEEQTDKETTSSSSGSSSGSDNEEG